MAIGNGMTPGGAGGRARRPGLLSRSDQREADGRGRGNAEHHGAPRTGEKWTGARRERNRIISFLGK
jgi:hypothetical protein